MHDRTPWEKGAAGPQTINGKTYKSLVEFKRPCSTCGELFSIFVTNKIASGHADSNSFGLKNCEQHRRNRPAGAEPAELAELRKELAEAQEMNVEQAVLIGQLKRQLAAYDLPAAMAAMPWQK